MSFGLAALGQAYQDAQANTSIAQVGDKAHRWLGVVHAAYSVGCLVGPLAVTGIASVKPGQWTWSYGALAGVAGLNVALLIWASGEDLLKNSQADLEAEPSVEVRSEEQGCVGDTRGRFSIWKETVEILREKTVWLISLFFFFFHLGSSITIGGWLFTYLLTLSPNSGVQASSIGYLPTLFYTGIALGRLLLIEPTHGFGEKPTLLIYSAL